MTKPTLNVSNVRKNLPSKADLKLTWKLKSAALLCNCCDLNPYQSNIKSNEIAIVMLQWMKWNLVFVVIVY